MVNFLCSIVKILSTKKSTKMLTLSYIVTASVGTNQQSSSGSSR